MVKYSDLTGQIFGKLLVLAHAGSKVVGTANPGKESLWRCFCECGEQVVVRRRALVEGKRWYCSRDRHRADSAKRAQERRGPRFDPRRSLLTYRSWSKMKERCAPGGKYEKYNVTVCDRWSNSYEAFVEDVGLRPGKEYSIDRIDTFRGYEPGNCRWATIAVQASNKRTMAWVEWGGKRRKLLEVCEEAGVSRSLVYQRLKIGWPLADALSTPVRPKARNRATSP